MIAISRLAIWLSLIYFDSRIEFYCSECQAICLFFTTELCKRPIEPLKTENNVYGGRLISVTLSLRSRLMNIRHLICRCLRSSLDLV